MPTREQIKKLWVDMGFGTAKEFNVHSWEKLTESQRNAPYDMFTRQQRALAQGGE